MMSREWARTRNFPFKDGAMAKSLVTRIIFRSMKWTWPGLPLVAKLSMFFGLPLVGLSSPCFSLPPRQPPHHATSIWLCNRKSRTLKFVFVVSAFKSPPGTCWGVGSNRNFLKFNFFFNLTVLRDLCFKNFKSEKLNACTIQL
jgi:hypothetical protein